MIKLKLPDNNQEKIEDIIQSENNKEDMTYSYGFLLRRIKLNFGIKSY